MNNQEGYILIFFSFFATILGLSANFYLMQSDINTGLQHAARLAFVVDEHAERVRSLLASHTACTANLAGEEIGQPNLADQVLRRTDGTTILSAGQQIETPVGPIEIRSMKLAMMVNQASGVNQEHLIIGANLDPRGRNTFNTLKNKVIKIPLKVKETGNIVEECFYDEFDFIEDRIRVNCEQVGLYNGLWLPCTITDPRFDDTEIHCGFDIIRIEAVYIEDPPGSGNRVPTYQITCGQGA